MKILIMLCILTSAFAVGARADTLPPCCDGLSFGEITGPSWISPELPWDIGISFDNQDWSVTISGPGYYYVADADPSSWMEAADAAAGAWYNAVYGGGEYWTVGPGNVIERASSDAPEPNPTYLLAFGLAAIVVAHQFHQHALRA